MTAAAVAGGLALAVSYALIGRASLAFAVPPATASLAWPAAALALVAVYRLGPCAGLAVLLGGALIEISSNGVSGFLRDPALWGIVAAETAHALTGRALIRRALAGRRLIDSPGAVLTFLFLGGPVASLVSATLGVASFWLKGAVPSDAVLGNWCAWWVGDTLGVLAFAPFFLALFLPRETRFPRRVSMLLLPLLAAYVTVFACFHFATRLDRAHLDDEVARRVASHVDVVHVAFDAALEAPLAVRDMVERRDASDVDAVRVVGGGFAARHPEVRAVEWIEVVPAADRAAFERAAAGGEFGSSAITERAADGRLVRAASRPVYYPVRAVEPATGNYAALGYDVGSDPVRRAALERAAATGEPAATERIDLVQAHGRVPGLLLVVPVYRSDAAGGSGAAHGHRELLGFAVSVVEVARLLETRLHGAREPGLCTQLVDLDAAPARRELYAASLSTRDRGPRDIATPRDIPLWQEPLSYAGRRYELRFFGTPSFLAQHHSLLPWTVLVVGLLFCAMLGTLLLLYGSRTLVLEQDVRTHTVGLRRALRREMRAHREHERTQRLLDAERAAGAAARAAADAATRAKSRFVATLEHEVRAPLDGVIGMTEALLTTRLDADQRECVRTLEGSAEALATLFGDIVDFARLEAGRFELDHAPVWVHELVRDVIALYQPAARDRGLALSWEIEESVTPCVLGDAARVRQVLLHVVGNAVKFTPRGWVRVQVSAPATDGARPILRFRVSDSGIGIAPAMQAAIFEPFTQVEGAQTRRQRGAGMGLSVARELVDRMGGTMEVESAPGWGATFTWQIPLEPADERATQFAACGWTSALAGDPVRGSLQSGESHAAPPGARAPRRPRILVVDDTPLHAAVAARIARRLGYETRQAGSGAAALALLATEDIDLVLMDCRMPGMDGFETTRRLRDPAGGARNPRVPVVALTAHALIGDRDACLAAGMNDYLAKPVKTQAMDETLSRWLSPTAGASAAA